MIEDCECSSTCTNFTSVLQTKNYILGVGKTEDGEICYQIKNKKYNVKEVETFLFPQALSNLKSLEVGLKAALQDLGEE